MSLQVSFTACLIILHVTSIHLAPVFDHHSAVIGPYPDRTISQRTIKFPDQFFRHVNKPVKAPVKTSLKEIQYAPLHVETKVAILSTSRSKIVATTPTGLRKEHLEPKDADANNQNMKCYNSNQGERIETVPPVSRSPGHNAIYRSYDMKVLRDKPDKAYKRSWDVVKKSKKMKKVLKKLNFLKPKAVVQQLEQVPVTTTTIATPSKDHVSSSFVSNQQYMANSDMSDKELLPAKPKRPSFFPFNKLHRIHLNIARVYSPVSQKTPTYSGSYALNIDTELAQMQSDLPVLLHLSNRSENNTLHTVTQM